MNSDTFALYSTAYPSTHPFALPAAGLTVAGTTRTAFALTNGNVAALQVPLQGAIEGSRYPMDPNMSGALTSGGLGNAGGYPQRNRPYFQSGSFDNGRPFRLRAVGTINVGATQTAKDVIIALYQGSSATLGSDSVLYTIPAQNTAGLGTSAAGVVAGAYNFIVEVTMIWDSTSQKLSPTEAWSNVCGTYATRAVGSSAITVTTPAGLSFVPAVEFGLANAANSAVLTEFSLEQV